jgi:hypothetical protein
MHDRAYDVMPWVTSVNIFIGFILSKITVKKSKLTVWPSSNFYYVGGPKKMEIYNFFFKIIRKFCQKMTISRKIMLCSDINKFQQIESKVEQT